jgi:hypothetical protein
VLGGREWTTHFFCNCQEIRIALWSDCMHSVLAYSDTANGNSGLPLFLVKKCRVTNCYF